MNVPKRSIDSAYRLVYDERTKSAILSGKLDEKRQVLVRNVVDPYDEMIVYGWVANDIFGQSYCFEDGDIGRIISLDLKETRETATES